MKKGFTLIELLAVMVILAILALIAVPIIFNIIEDAKNNAKIVSSDNYLKALEFSIAKSVTENKMLNDGIYQIMSNGNLCMGELTGSTCSDEVEVKVDGEVPNTGTVTLFEGKIANYKFIFKNGFLVTNKICKLIDGKTNEIGSKYECEVKEGTKYNFYVLSLNEDGTANLIMEQNIYYDESAGTSGIATSSNTKWKVAWYETSALNSNGPVTAMTYLHNATKDWNKVPNIVVNYTDEGTKYGSVKTTGTLNTETIVTTKDGNTVTGTYENLKARLPMRKEVDDQGCDGSGKVSCPTWLSSSDLTSGGVRGYWTFASESANTTSAYRVRWNQASGLSNANDNTWGVRPVINVKL